MALPPARQALLEAVARGRVAPSSIQTRPPPAPARLPPELQGLAVEDLQLCSEASSSSHPQAWVPVRLAKRAGEPPGRRLPVAVLLHSTGSDMGSLAGQQAELARRGYLAAALDCRYHGARSAGGGASAGRQLARMVSFARDEYQAALVAAWRGSGERPFLLDNVWDVLRLLDYLEQRPDVDAARIGMTGVSLGGMHTWLAAAADERVAAAAPMIGVQWFGWALAQRRYQARVDSIPNVFHAAAADMAAQRGGGGGAGGGSGGGITPEVVAAVWEKLLPGLLEGYDAHLSLPLLAPRPLLIANGELDPRCPMEGVEAALAPAREAYAAAGAADRLQLYIEPGVGHECTPGMWQHSIAFFDAHLRPGS